MNAKNGDEDENENAAHNRPLMTMEFKVAIGALLKAINKRLCFEKGINKTVCWSDVNAYRFHSVFI